MRGSNSLIVSAIKWIVIVGALFIIGGKLLNPEVTDVTNLVKASKSSVEQSLGVSLVRDPGMVKKIYEYTDGEITVDADDEGVAMVYIDGKQSGLHIDDEKYSMYGLTMGDLMIDLENKLTYDYDDRFDVINDMYEGVSTGEFFCNTKRNDCLIVVYNDHTSRVVALTYFNDMNKVTEQLSPAY